MEISIKKLKLQKIFLRLQFELKFSNVHNINSSISSEQNKSTSSDDKMRAWKLKIIELNWSKSLANPKFSNKIAKNKNFIEQ